MLLGSELYDGKPDSVATSLSGRIHSTLLCLFHPYAALQLHMTKNSFLLVDSVLLRMEKWRSLAGGVMCGHCGAAPADPKSITEFRSA